MKYNCAVMAEAEKAADYLVELIDKDAIVEVKRISPKRSLSQNSYLHLLLGDFGMHFGYTIEESKQIYKSVNESLYTYKKQNRVFYRSSADLTVEEMAKSIDRFMTMSAENRHILPPATNKEWIRQVENAIEEAKYFL